MNLSTIIGVLALVLILGLAIRYIVRKKQSGAKCIGCPAGGSCVKCTCNNLGLEDFDLEAPSAGSGKRTD